MSEAKHTPGPWQASDCDFRGVYAEGGAALVATCHTTSLPEGSQANRTDVTRANARLIAAAPELLAACEAVLHQLERGEASELDPSDLLWCASCLRGSIAKARGN